jgi:hypothetical protein
VIGIGETNNSKINENNEPGVVLKMTDRIRTKFLIIFSSLGFIVI